LAKVNGAGAEAPKKLNVSPPPLGQEMEQPAQFVTAQMVLVRDHQTYLTTPLPA
jgi:hypothetical protein